MHIPSIAIMTTSLVLLTLTQGCAARSPPAPAQGAPLPLHSSDHADMQPGGAKPAKTRSGQRRVYRLDFVVSAIDPGGAGANSAYSLNLEEEKNGEIHVGSNVALSSQARMDVGLKLRCQVETLGESLLLHTSTEMSSADTTPTIHKISANGDALLSPGQSTMVASMEDPTTHKRFTVTVTATKLL